VSEYRGELDEADCRVREPEGHDVPEDDGEARLIELSSSSSVEALRDSSGLLEAEPLRIPLLDAGLSDKEAVLLCLNVKSV
jgi:hypothetical protein